MRAIRAAGEAFRGIGAAVRSHPGVFAGAAGAVALLSVALPALVLSAVRKPVDFFTFNPWLSRLPEYLVSDVPAGEKARKLWALALFWFSSDSPYGTEWGFAVDVGDLVRILVTALLFGAYFALWRFSRRRLAGAPRPARGGVLGAAASVVGLSTGPCSVMGCGAPVLPVVGLAFVGLSSGTLAFLAGLSSVTTPAILAVLVVAVVRLGWRAGATRALATAAALGLALLAGPADATERPPRLLNACAGDLSEVSYWKARLRSPDPRVRAEAARALGQTRTESVVPSLAEALRDPDASVRAEARRALERLELRR